MSSYCAKCKWNMGRFNSHCMECHCGSGYEEKYDDTLDTLDAMIYSNKRMGILRTKAIIINAIKNMCSKHNWHYVDVVSTFHDNSNWYAVEIHDCENHKYRAEFNLAICDVDTSKFDKLEERIIASFSARRARDELRDKIYITTARGYGKSNWLYEKMMEAKEQGKQIHMVRKNGMSQVEKLKEELNMRFGFMCIKDVIFNDPATIVFWSDGSKTIVKAHNEEFDPEKGLAMAICKKLYGNKGNFNNLFKKWIPEEKIVADDVIDAFNKVMNEPEESESKKYLEIGKAADEGIQAGLQSKSISACKYYTVKALSKEQGVSESTIRGRIANGIYPGAFKQSGAWVIPVKK